MRSDNGLETLFDLDGYIITQDLGCWVKVAVWRVVATPKIPHGIRYSLTLHEPYGKRIMESTTAMP
ncbi:hypothetical protein [Nitrosospira sp. NRS527]|uniref:hypothetical protein n=1 Tax=Nitrosospira sp. NRS527 TaxID=155925 RepID=UPI001AF1740C|nr:hypothetical protein [Nitrosospira sp. NRS527]BCT69469.1 hypothetical protein NNRS527_03093 [Nitrosospira sp. NRS527]